MANSIDYAKNLLGENQTGYFGQQEDVAKAKYGTDWNTLKTRFRNVADALKRKERMANVAFSGDIADVAERDFDRSMGAEANLASRGLTNSGIASKMDKSLTNIKGDEVSGLLGNLGQGVVDTAESRASAVQDLMSGGGQIGGSYTGTLADIGDARLANARNYGQSVASIAGSKDARDTSNAAAAASRAASARSRGTSPEEQKLEDEQQEYARKKLIARIANDLDSEMIPLETTDYNTLYNEAQTPEEQALIRSTLNRENFSKENLLNLLADTDPGYASDLVNKYAMMFNPDIIKKGARASAEARVR